jgi:hypothetical protein
MKLKQGQVYIRNGYGRELELVRSLTVKVKTVGTPCYKSAGRPPVSGTIRKTSFLKWLKNNASLPGIETKSGIETKHGIETKTIKIQLVI